MYQGTKGMKSIPAENNCLLRDWWGELTIEVRQDHQTIDNDLWIALTRGVDMYNEKS